MLLETGLASSNVHFAAASKFLRSLVMFGNIHEVPHSEKAFELDLSCCNAFFRAEVVAHCVVVLVLDELHHVLASDLSAFADAQKLPAIG